MKKLKTIFKISYYIIISFIAIIAFLLVISIFPITGNIKFMIVQSGSMEPAIKTGSIVLIKPVNDYKVGDIISFGEISKTRAPITHRIYSIKENGGQTAYITKGDANDGPDEKEVSKREVLGKVLFSVPYLGYVVDFAKKPLGFIFMLVVPATIIIFDEIKKIYGEIRKRTIKKGV